MQQSDQRAVGIVKQLAYGCLIFSVVLTCMAPMSVMANSYAPGVEADVATDETLTAVAVFEPAKIITALNQPIMMQDADVALATLEKITPPPSLPTPIVIVEEQPVPAPASPILITSYRIDDGRLSFVQLYNNSSSMMKLDDWRIEYTLSHHTEPTITLPIQLTAWLPARQYAVYGQTGLAVEADAEYDMPLTSGYTVTNLQITPPAISYAPYVVTGGLFTDHGRYDLSVSSAGNYTSTSKYKETIAATSLYGGGLYMHPSSANFRVVEVLAHANDCSPATTDISCGDYVKIHNPTAEFIELDGYRLRIGFQGQSSSISNTVKLKGILPAGEYTVVNYRDDDQALSVTNAGGYVWIEDLYGLKIYEPTIQMYEDASADAHQGQSWAFDGSGWTWGVPSPNGRNTFLPPDEAPQSVSALQPCKDNQYRSEETNRCRTIVASTVATPCKDGQYRSEETNRCRNLVLAGSTLVACKDDQYRSEATNRCRSLVTTASTLTPCKDNQYRSEETNRCRNITATNVPVAAFAVEPVAETGIAFVGWYVLGGVGAIAVAYAAWEWRRETMSAIRRIASFFTKQ